MGICFLDTLIYTGLVFRVRILLRKILSQFHGGLDWLTGSGYAKYIALPLLRAFYATKGDDINSITKDEALGVIRKCMEVLYYRV